MIRKDIIDLIKVKPDTKVRLKDYHTGWDQTDELKSVGKNLVKERAGEILQTSIEDLSECQQLLYADDRYALLIVLQAMDAAPHPWPARRSAKRSGHRRKAVADIPINLRCWFAKSRRLFP